MRKVLLPVDGSEQSDRAVRWLADFIGERGPVEIHIANIEPEPVAWQTHGMEPEAIDAHLSAVGHHAVRSAQEILKAAGVAYHTHLARGDVAQSIVALADKLGCDTIAMGTHGLGAIAGLAMGSVTRKVLHLSRVPVVCVK